MWGDVGRRDCCAELLVGEIGSVLAGVCMVFAIGITGGLERVSVGVCRGMVLVVCVVTCDAYTVYGWGQGRQLDIYTGADT